MMTEAEVRESWMATQRERLNVWRREMRAEGVPLAEIERMAQLTEERSAANLERNLPLMMRDLALTSGSASSH